MAPTRRLSVQPSSAQVLAQGMTAIRTAFKLPAEFPPEVEAVAAQAATQPRLPGLDRSDLALVTIDPPGSMDLDQALLVERREGGYRVYYAIADVAAFVSPGDALDLETNRRGETLYGADSKIPLHPKVLSEGAASLLPDQLRPALLWTIELDATGEIATIDVRRAQVRSRARLDYLGVQQRIDAGTAEPMWTVLREIGELRKRRELQRGGISLPLPEQEIGVADDGQWTLSFRARHPVEDWNEQISLLTGMAAAQLMMRAKVGLLRTLPAPEPAAIARLRRTAAALQLAWPEAQTYPDFIRSLDPAQARHIAMMVACTSVLRGAAYAAFDGELPAQPLQWALAAPYAHATAPLRRLADRYVGEICVAVCAGTPIPDWTRRALPGLPATMQAADHRANGYERAVIELAEAAALAVRVGQRFSGSIVEIEQGSATRGTVMLHEQAIEAKVSAATALPLGAEVQVILTEAEPLTRTVRFELAG